MRCHLHLASRARRCRAGRARRGRPDRRRAERSRLFRHVDQCAKRGEEDPRRFCGQGRAYARRAGERWAVGAQSRKMAIWVGGERGSFDKYKAVLDAMGDRPAYIGAIGSATVAKLVHNMSSYAVTCALAETFTMGVKAGMDPVALWEAVRQGVSGRRPTFDGLLEQFLPGKYDPANFALKLATKDVKLATELGRELGVPMRICNLAYAEMSEACNRGWEGRDSRVVMLLQEERAGVTIASDPERVRQAAERARGGG